MRFRHVQSFAKPVANPFCTLMPHSEGEHSRKSVSESNRINYAREMPRPAWALAFEKKG
jgi:hypothetical protein